MIVTETAKRVQTYCQNWPRQSNNLSDCSTVPPCLRPWCPCLLNADSTVSHGLSERRFQFDHWKRRFPVKTDFLTWIAHSRNSLTAKEQTRLVHVVDDAVRSCEPDAVLWTFIHWRAIENRIFLPHLHIGIWSDSPTNILAAFSNQSLLSRVKEKGSFVKLLRTRGRPTARTCIGDDPAFLVRLDTTNLWDGGDPEQWLYHVMKCKVEQDVVAVPPPKQHRWHYGTALVKAKAVRRWSSKISRLVRLVEDIREGTIMKDEAQLIDNSPRLGHSQSGVSDNRGWCLAPEAG